MRDVIRRLLVWVGGLGPLVLGALLVIVIGIWAFAEIADEVTEGESQVVDEWILHAFRRADDPSRPIGPGWLQGTAIDITALGGVFVLSFMTIAVCTYLFLVRKHHAMWLVLIASAGGLLLSTGLKFLFERDRPSLVPHLTQVYSASFPSGHAMLSTVVYLTLGSLLARLVETPLVKLYFLGVALLLSFLIGLSRVFLGVHYPTDVLAGWTAGLVWALVCWVTARYLQRRGAVEKDTETTTSREVVAGAVGKVGDE